MSSDKKKWDKTEKDRKNMEKENNSDESYFSENEIPNLNSLKPFEFEPKTAFLQPYECNFIKIEFLTQAFSCQFCEHLSKNTFFTECIRWLFL